MERNSAGARHSWARQHAWLLLNFFQFPVGHPPHPPCSLVAGANVGIVLELEELGHVDGDGVARYIITARAAASSPMSSPRARAAASSPRSTPRARATTSSPRSTPRSRATASSPRAKATVTATRASKVGSQI